jgi:hypothetical protein
LIIAAGKSNPHSGNHIGWLLVVSENKINRRDHAQAGPDEVGFNVFFQIKNGKGYKNQQGDDFLEDFQLGHIIGGMTDPVGGDLNHVFKEGDAPTDDRGQKPGLGGQAFQVPIPGKGHKDIRTG